MGYLKVYNYHYNITFYAVKSIFIDEFKKAKAKNRPFLPMANNILRQLNHFRDQKFEARLKEYAVKSYLVFLDRYSLYEGEKSEVIFWVLEDEALKAFSKTVKYPYSSFIEDLAIRECLNEVGRHFSNYYNYYQLIYKHGCYHYFYLKDFVDCSFESSQEYKSMSSEGFKNHQESLKNDNDLQVLKNEDYKSQYNIDINHLIGEFVNGQYLEPIKKPIVEPNSNKEIKADKLKSEKQTNVESLINQFSDNERFLIIHVLYKLINNDVKDEEVQYTNITGANMMKIIRLAGTFNDNSIFSQDSKSNTSYSKVAKGISYYGVSKRLELLESTILKLQAFKIDILVAELERMKTKHLQKQRKS
jgi:hypothetical protein